MDKAALCRRISAVDFSIWELHLFLDTHPHNTEALEKRRQLLAERARLIELYEQNFGPYAVSPRHSKGDRWAWIDDPWPWEPEGGCC